MNRRNFLSLFSAGVAGLALEQAIPLGRVWSFPKEIVIGDFIALPPGSSARVIEAWDYRLRAKVQRLDIIAPIFAAQPILAVDSCKIIRGIDKLRPDMFPEVASDSFRKLHDAVEGRLGADQFYGITTRMPFTYSEPVLP